MADMAEIWYVTIQLFLSFFNFGSLPPFTINLTYSEVFFDAGSDAVKIKVIRRVVFCAIRENLSYVTDFPALLTAPDCAKKGPV